MAAKSDDIALLPNSSPSCTTSPTHLPVTRLRDAVYWSHYSCVTTTVLIGHITPIKTSEVSVSVQNKPSCSPSNNKSPEKPSCSPKTDGNQKSTPKPSMKPASCSSARGSLKRKASCTPEKEEIKKLEGSPMKREPKSLTSPRKKGKLIKLEPLPENEVLTDNSNTKWVLAKVLANEKTVLFYEAHTAPRNDKRGQCILKLDSKDGKIYNEQTFFQRAAKKIAVDKWKKSHACPALGIPTCIGFGVHENYRFLVFSALGQNLQTIIKERKFGDTLPEQAVYQIVYRMIDALEYIHENEYVHGDITADNIFVNPDVLEVFLAGYYNAYRYCPAGKHVAYREGSRTPHEGTAEFISLDIHKGTGPTRRSDFESLGYCMLKWLSGSLPWSEETCVRSIMEYKKRFKTDVPGLLKQCFNRKKIPDVLKTYLEYVMTLEYEEMPDYEKMRKNISSAMEKMAVLPYDPVQL
ncbi:inactive serine/threonine-protein kinase VRK3 isoform X2 [Pseudophryne corroboree]|uniref:inactive serine/threonine-protein kinase VRK3 isoform X2 n=1 Tax=Pseudophryne corroboree TaxID=495146 RepID=UPI003081AF70